MGWVNNEMGLGRQGGREFPRIYVFEVLGLTEQLVAYTTRDT